MRKIDKAFMADAVLMVKKEVFNEGYITCYECTRIASSLERRFSVNGYDIGFTAKIESTHFFDLLPGIIQKKARYENVNLSSIIANSSLEKMIYDKRFIQDCLYEIQLERLVKYVDHNCATCSDNSTCKDFHFNYCCDKWHHDISINVDGVIKK